MFWDSLGPNLCSFLVPLAQVALPLISKNCCLGRWEWTSPAPMVTPVLQIPCITSALMVSMSI